MFFENIKARLDRKFGYRHPETYTEELNCQCRVIAVPAGILAVVAWFPFIPLDIALYPHLPIIIYLRVGYAVMGLVILVFHYVPLEKVHPFFVKYKDYCLIVSLIGYLELSSGLIAGLTRAPPAYMGGYGIVILILCFTPFRFIHIWILIIASLAIFTVTGLHLGMTFQTGSEKYGLLNVIIAVVMVILLAAVLGHIKKHRYLDSLRIQKKDDENIMLLLKEKGISKREEEIFHLLIRGKSNNEIEAELFISMHTVKSHIYTIYRKLGIKGRLQLMHMVREIKEKW